MAACTGVTPAPYEGEIIVYVKSGPQVWNARVTGVNPSNCHVDLVYGINPGGDPEVNIADRHHISQGGIPYWCRASELPAQLQGSPRFC